MQHTSVEAHLFGAGPKRMLALDGGGIRGILTLQMLRRIEQLVRDRSGQHDAVLSDYFDLIGGTSTGAIIASALALGWEVDRIETLYLELGNSIFEPSMFRKGLLRPKFSAKPVRDALRREYADIRLGGPELRTGLAVVLKRLDTGSPWVVHNNPRGVYYNVEEGRNSIANKDFLLRDVVRASTAAPTYFEPESIAVADGLVGAFIDGGISPHNNPALQMLMLATLKGHRLNWPTGADQLLLVSLGTGSQTLRMAHGEVASMKPMELGLRGLASLMDDACALNETLLQWMSSSPTAQLIDTEIGDLSGDTLGGAPPLLSYLRYDVRFDDDWLRDRLNIALDPGQLEAIAKMDRAGNMGTLTEIGKAAASLIDDDHFPAVFDIAPGSA